MEEVSEELVNAGTSVAGRLQRPQLGYLAVVSVVAFGAGGGIAWVVAKRRYEAKYEQLAAQEIAEAKAFYSKLHKGDQYATPGEAVEALGATGGPAVEALARYQGKNPDSATEVVVTETTEVEVNPIHNVFEDRETDDEWDQDEELKKRETMDPEEPYILSQDEYLEGELDYKQQTLTYFAEDDVLVDEKEQPINLIDTVVGEENLTRFGHGSGDNRIVYIRNDKLSMDFEIVKNEGSYTREVLGFQHSDDGHRIKKFRGGDV
jgi:hypothetical protein